MYQVVVHANCYLLQLLTVPQVSKKVRRAIIKKETAAVSKKGGGFYRRGDLSRGKLE